MPLGHRVWPQSMRVRICELDRTHAKTLDTVFAGLSGRSRYLRFGRAVDQLPSEDRRRLGELDGMDHVAFAAFARHRRSWRPIGVIRFIRTGPGSAEVAAEVVDDWQGRGVGTRLMRIVRQRAVLLGYTELYAEILAGNEAAQSVLRKVCPLVRVDRGRGACTMTARIADVPEISMADIIGQLDHYGPSAV
jgi:RimJ/RimL family protein N-acetyltransferase